MVGRYVHGVAAVLLVAAMLAGCTGGSLPTLGTRTDFVPPDDECWPAIERCHDSAPLCPALCR